MKELYDYQNEGIAAIKERRRCVLADGMGLGKTAETLHSVFHIGCRVLVICPKTVIGVWEDQIKDWFQYTSSYRLDWKCCIGCFEAKPNFTIVNYENIIARGGENWRAELLAKEGWTAIIFDEAHRLKNRKSKTFQAAKHICRKKTDIPLIAVTATPVLNTPQELWPLLHIIDPKEFSSFWKWVYKYFRTRPSYFNPKAVEIGEVINADRLKQDMEPYIIRRTKEEVWDQMPAKTIQNTYVEMEGEQYLFYKKMLHEMYVEFQGGKYVDAINVISQMTRLKQITVSHHLLDEGSDELKGAKISALNEIIEGAGEQKIVIFSQYAKAINRLTLPSGVRFTGADPNSHREECIYRFQNDPQIRILATTMQCGGQGITLTAGTIAVFLDLLWTPALNSQAIDRLHRIGQTMPVTAINLVAKDSIEDYILSVLQDKEDIFNSVIPETKISKHLVDYVKDCGK